MSFAIAVLNCIRSMSRRTPSIVRCTACFVGRSAGSSETVRRPVSSSTTRRHRRCRKRCEPTTARVSQGRERSSGPIDISYTRRVSAPYSSYMSSGATAFFSDLPIFPYSWVTGSPW